MPWRRGQPAYLNVPGSDALYIPVFSDQAKLETLMAQADTPYSSIKLIQNEPEFLSSIPHEIKIMFDPYFTPEGRVRWAEVQRD